MISQESSTQIAIGYPINGVPCNRKPVNTQNIKNLALELDDGFSNTYFHLFLLCIAPHIFENYNIYTNYTFPLLTRNEDAGHVSSLYVGWMDLHMIYSLRGVHHQRQVPVFCSRDFEERSAE